MGDVSNEQRILDLTLEALTFNKPIVNVLSEALKVGVSVKFEASKAYGDVFMYNVICLDEKLKTYCMAFINPEVLQESIYYPNTTAIEPNETANELIHDPPYYAEDLDNLDVLHASLGLGREWLASEARREISLKRKETTNE